MSEIPLRWIKNNIEGSKFAFGGGRYSPEFTYLGAPIHADFELNYENLSPYVTEVLDLSAKLEAAGMDIKVVKIIGGVVEVY